MNSLQYFHKTGSAKCCTRRKIGAGIKRFCIREEKQRQWPATSTSHSTSGCHINLVNPRAFFSIHFDTYKIGIKKIGNILIFKGFVRHHVTPVTSGIPNGKKNRFIFFFGKRQSFISPWIPVYRIISMLLQIWAFFVEQVVSLCILHADSCIFTMHLPAGQDKQG